MDRYNIPAEAYSRPLREGLPNPIPPRMARLPRDHRGYPVPFFVAWVDGVADFRVSDGRRLFDCVSCDLCWLCGQKLGAYRSFVIGPMCVVNRVSSEPPSHRDCAEWAAQACPFLARPSAERRTTNMPEQHVEPAGIAIKRNPGVAVVWTTKKFRLVRVEGEPGVNAGVLFDVGEPDSVTFWAHGRKATLEEVEASIESGCPSLRVEAEKDGPSGVESYERSLAAAWKVVEVNVPGGGA